MGRKARRSLKYADIKPETQQEVTQNEIEFKNKIIVKSKSENQTDVIHSILDNDITFIDGVAGSGKTYLACGMALELLQHKQVSKIIVSRPTIECGASIGFLPGDFHEKVSWALQPVMLNFSKFVDKHIIKKMMELEIIEIIPVQHMRGLTFEDTICIVDECQNLTEEQLKCIVTRIGKNSKIVLTGDGTQSDLNQYNSGAFYRFCQKLQGIDGIGVCHLEEIDIVRHPIIVKILERLKEV